MQAYENDRREGEMKADEIQRILILGSGMIGQQIGLQFALHGMEVVLYDLSEERLQAALDQLKVYLDGFARQGRITFQHAEVVLARFHATTDPKEAARDVDLVSESLPEDPQLKGSVLAQFNQICPPRTIFTTNTSTLLPSQFARQTGRPAQFCGYHFYPPVWEANVVEIMAHKGTAQEVTVLLREFSVRAGLEPVVLAKENTGYILNAFLMLIFYQALTLVVNGVSSVEEIDHTWEKVTHSSFGPFHYMDEIGLETVWKIQDYWAGRIFFLPQIRMNANYVLAMLKSGKNGRKSGQGFYTYSS